jgi:hypothetical protein
MASSTSACPSAATTSWNERQPTEALATTTCGFRQRSSARLAFYRTLLRVRHLCFPRGVLREPGVARTGIRFPLGCLAQAAGTAPTLAEPRSEWWRSHSGESSPNPRASLNSTTSCSSIPQPSSSDPSFCSCLPSPTATSDSCSQNSADRRRPAANEPYSGAIPFAISSCMAGADF